MWDTLLYLWHILDQPIDASRPHDIDMYVAWHGRFMIFAWGVCIPIGIIIARFFKITCTQDFPRVVDNKFWWYSHLSLQILGSLVATGALVYVLMFGGNHDVPVHQIMGWITMIGLCVQVGLGQLRGRMGGPTDTVMYGDHYYMTQRRYLFEYCHKYLGYALVLCSWATGATGMWYVNAPLWMWGALGAWLCILILVFGYLQYRGYAVDTYEAIWGIDRQHPGNEKMIIPNGVRRLRLEYQGKIPKKNRHIEILGRYNTNND